MGRVGDAAVILVLLSLGWVLYDPMMQRPVDYVDFPENIRALSGHTGFLDGFLSLTERYRAHGRWNPIAFAFFTVQWNAFESWVPGWYLVRFAVFSGVVALAYTVFKRLQLNTPGAASATCLLVFSPPAVAAWMRLTTAEPLVTLFVAGACHFALATNTRVRSWGLAVMLGGIMLTKEAAVTAFALPAALSVLTEFNHARDARFWLTALHRLLPSLFVLMLGAIPIIWTLASSPPSSFALQYGTGELNSVDIAASALTAVVPFALDRGSLFSLFAFLVLAVAGWVEGLRRRSDRVKSLSILILSVSVPILGALTYAPWHFYTLVYALPFMTAGALLFGGAVSFLSSTRRIDRLVAALGLAITLSYALTQAHNAVGRLDAVRSVFAASVSHVAGLGDVDSVLVGSSSSDRARSGNFGALLTSYADMQGQTWPAVRDVPCDSAVPENARVIVMIFSPLCSSGGKTATIVARYRKYIWPDPRSHSDSVTVAFDRL